MRAHRCRTGSVYRLLARTFPVGVYDGEAFLGLRDHRGSLELAVEHHVDDGPPFGTAVPVAEIGRITGIELVRYTGYTCRRCGDMVQRRDRSWVHLASSCRYQGAASPVPNTRLAAYLAAFEHVSGH